MQYPLPFLIESPDTSESTPRRLGGRDRQILLGGKLIAYSFRRSQRKTIGIAVSEHGLQAAAPRWVNIAEVEAFLHEKQRWIFQRLAEVRTHLRRPFVWREGARIPYLGREFELCLTTNGRTRLDGEQLIVSLDDELSAQALRETTLQWLKTQALELFQGRVQSIAPSLKVEIPPIRLSRARTQWGSCARKADGSTRVLLNWKLIHFELPLIDYVVTHELAHLRHMNHSGAFWREVGRVYPDYAAARLALRERAHWAPEL